MNTRKNKYKSKKRTQTLKQALRLYHLMKSYHHKNYRYVPKSLAILIVGRVKGYTHVKDKLKKLQKKYHAKMFCSLNKRTKSDYIQNFCNMYNINDEDLNLEAVSPPEYLTKYNVPVHLLADRVYSCCYHKEKCFELMEKFQEKHGMKFDCVLYYRADVDEFEEFKFDPLEEDTVFIPAEKYPHIRDTHGINDQIAYGNYEAMKKYCGIINSLKDICDEEGILYHPELLVKKYIDRMNLKVKRIPYDYMLHPSRLEPLAEYDDYE